MSKIVITLTLSCFLFVGCEALRFAPNETQKQNAWLHNRTTAATAQTARIENSSEKLQKLTSLSQLQSRGFVSYFGLPKQYPQAETADDILAQSSFTLAQQATQQSAERPDAFELADNAFELAVGFCALLGGVYGTKGIQFLTASRAKSKALRQIIEGNELFKKQNTDSVAAFKHAQNNQSPQTRKLVAEIKT